MAKGAKKARQKTVRNQKNVIVEDPRIAWVFIGSGVRLERVEQSNNIYGYRCIFSRKNILKSIHKGLLKKAKK
jgi:hypothetical protein